MTYQPPKEEMDALLRMVEYQASKAVKKAPDVRRDDLISEGNLALMMALLRYDPEGPASAWTYTEKRVAGAMKDLIQRHRRPGMSKRNTNPAYVFEPISDDIEAPSSRAGGDLEDIESLFSVVLNPVQEVVLRLHLDGYSYPEIGEKLGIDGPKAGKVYREAVAILRTKTGSRTDI